MKEHKNLYIVALFVFSTLLSSGVNAESEVETLVDNLVERYGGDNLIAIKTISIKDNYKQFNATQNHNPDKVDVDDYRISMNIDFINQRKNFRRLLGNPKVQYVWERIFDGEHGYQINHDEGTVQIEPNLTFENADWNYSYALDTLLVKMLYNARNTAKFIGKQYYQGRSHQKISFKTNAGKELTLFVDELSGLISQMTRAHYLPNELYSYNFSNHQNKKGIIYATASYVTSARLPHTVTMTREVLFNTKNTNTFQAPSQYKKSPQEIDAEEMRVRVLAPGVYHVGKNWGFSIFVDMGDHFIASGAYREFKQRFEAVKTFTSKDKPLKYQIVTHHHLDHLGGINQVAALGASFITVEEHVSSIKAQAGIELSDDKFILVDEKISLLDDRLQVIDVATSHSDHNLISYFPSSKIAFIADHFYSRKKSGSIQGDPDLVLIRNKLAKYQFDVKKFAAAHSHRTLTTAELNQAIEHIINVSCPKGWDICSNE